MNKMDTKNIPCPKKPAKSPLGGFTLVELLVVALIIAILAAVAYPQYRVSVYRARFTQLQAAARPIMLSLERYYMQNGKHPDSLDELDIGKPAGIYAQHTNCHSAKRRGNDIPSPFPNA